MVQSAVQSQRGSSALRAASPVPRRGLSRFVHRHWNSVRKRLRDFQLVRTALVVRERTGKSLPSQAAEVVALRLGKGRLRPFEYYAYELFDPRYSFEEKKQFVSWSAGLLNRKLNSPTWVALCSDKAVTYALLRGLEIPHPEVYAVYHPGGRTFGGVPCARTPEELAGILRDGMRYPFFGKPVSDRRGSSASSVRAIDRGRDLLIMADDTEIPVAEFVRELHRRQVADSRQGAAGYLFQELVTQNAFVDGLSGGRIGTLRMVVLLGRDGPRLFRVTWKMPVGSNITDHALEGTGNIKCSIDPATGRVERALQMSGPEGTTHYALEAYGRPVEYHPDTGARITDVCLPDWKRTVSLCLRAAAALPGLGYQSWDVVMGVEGPIFLELNHLGGVAQTPGCVGFNDAEFRSFMRGLGKR